MSGSAQFGQSLLTARALVGLLTQKPLDLMSVERLGDERRTAKVGRKNIGPRA